MKRSPQDQVQFWRSAELISLTVSLILLSLQLNFIRPYFLVNDDIFKIFLTKGIGLASQPVAYFEESNVLLGSLFVKWFGWFPAFPWYGWFLCAVQWLSFWAFLWVLCLKRPGWSSPLLFAISYLAVQFIFFTYFQFTMVASLAAGTGMVLFVSTFQYPAGPRRLGLWTLSGALLWISSLIRMDAFLFMLIVSIPFVLLEINRVPFKAILKQQWKFLGVVSLFVLFSTGYNAFWYQGHPAWKNYLAFGKSLQKVLEYQPSDYSPETKPLFDSLGWSENDHWSFKNWGLADPKKFSLESLKKLSDQLPRAGTNGKTASFHSLAELFGSFWDLRFVAYFFVFWLFCRGRASLFLLAQGTWIVALFLFLLYFFKATDRVTLPALAFWISLSLLYAEEPFGRNRPKGSGIRSWLPWFRVAVLGVAFVLAFPTLRDYYHQNLQKRQVEDGMRACVEKLDMTPQRVYVMWGFPFEPFNAFDDFERFRSFRMVVTSVLQRSPATSEMLAQFGVRDVFRDAVDNPSIVMICTTEQGIHYHKYLEENFHLETYATKIFDCPFFKAFTIHSSKKT